MNADSYGDALDCTLKEITKLHKTIAAQAAVIEKLIGIVKVCSPLAAYGRVGTRDVEQAKFQKAIKESLAIPTDSTQILDEVRRAEREKCAKVCDENHWDDHRLFAEKIRAME